MGPGALPIVGGGAGGWAAIVPHYGARAGRAAAGAGGVQGAD